MYLNLLKYNENKQNYLDILSPYSTQNMKKNSQIQYHILN